MKQFDEGDIYSGIASKKSRSAFLTVDRQAYADNARLESFVRQVSDQLTSLIEGEIDTLTIHATGVR